MAVGIFLLMFNDAIFVTIIVSSRIVQRNQ